MNKLTISKAVVEIIGFHRWQDAVESQRYLAHKHRHKFRIEFTCVFTINRHNTRAVEYHWLEQLILDVLDKYKTDKMEYEFSNSSCEGIAHYLVDCLEEAMKTQTNNKLTHINCMVYEDNMSGGGTERAY